MQARYYAGIIRSNGVHVGSCVALTGKTLLAFTPKQLDHRQKINLELETPLGQSRDAEITATRVVRDSYVGHREGTFYLLRTQAHGMDKVDLPHTVLLPEDEVMLCSAQGNVVATTVHGQYFRTPIGYRVLPYSPGFSTDTFNNPRPLCLGFVGHSTADSGDYVHRFYRCPIAWSNVS